jgi:hypothetical protein
MNDLAKYTCVLLALLLASCTQTVSETTIVRDDDQDGRVAVLITDDAASLSGVSSIRVTVDNIQLFSPEEGWVTINGDEETYDLLQLRESYRLLANANVDAGTYTQMKIDLSSVMVTDALGDHDAKLPSEKYNIVADIIVTPGTTSTATLDFLADSSLHITEDGEYVFAPVIAVQTCTGATVVADDGLVTATCGEVVTDVTYGMDLGGNVGVNVIVPDAPIVIERGVFRTTVTTINTTRTIYNDRTVYVDRPVNGTNGTVETNTTVNVTA